MYKLISIILISVFITPVSAENNKLLVETLKSVFTDHKTDAELNSLISKGEWSKSKAAFVLSERVGRSVLISVFVKKTNKFTHVKLWEFKMNKPMGKLSKPLDYYDRYEIKPSIYDIIDKDKKFAIGYRVRAWKNGQRYTTHLKPVYIRHDLILDWSAYRGTPKKRVTIE